MKGPHPLYDIVNAINFALTLMAVLQILMTQNKQQFDS
jgi:hypothetical protein